MSDAPIVIRGAREHNLQNVSLTLPRNKLIVMTGVSGSGKSSLAFDTLYAEGQRRYVESLSSYARQFLGQMPKPEVDAITGLAPSISIQQKSAGKNPRSTVGTITEIYDYLRVLFARVGHPFCYQCGRPIAAQSREHIIEALLALPEGTRFHILAPVVQRQKGEFKDFFQDLLKQGYLRARVDGKLVELDTDLKLDKQMWHTIDVVVDRLVAGKSPRGRIAEAVENALALTDGRLIVATEPANAPPSANEPRSRAAAVAPHTVDQLFSTEYACRECGISYEPPSPQLFSFNSPLGMCLDCNGLGVRHGFVVNRLVADPRLSIAKGALQLLGKLSEVGRWRRHILEGVGRAIEADLKLPEGALLKTPWEQLPDAARQEFLHGLGDRTITFVYRHRGGVWKHSGKWPGYVAELAEEYRKTRNPMRRVQLEKYMEVVGCTTCHGSRLNRQASSYRVTSARRPPTPAAVDDGAHGRAPRGATVKPHGPAQMPVGPVEVPKSSGGAPHGPAETTVGPAETTVDPAENWPRRPASTPWSLTLPQVCSLSIAEAAAFFEDLELTATERQIAEEVLKEIRGRLGFLLRCGLEYLTLDRTAPTLSGGESQRIRLAGQIGCGLVGVVYILDEPSIGLHPRDNALLLGSLQDLRDQGNTVIVVEHDEDTMKAADFLVDFGPGPGVRGGKIVAQGSVNDVLQAADSLTGAYLAGRRRIEVPACRRSPGTQKLIFTGCRHHNLRHITAEFPLGTFICVTGVSGSGKSSLVNDIVWEVLNREINRGAGQPGAYEQVLGLEYVDKAIAIDQTPIGRTPRSNPATYVKLFDLIRELYTHLPDARLRGFKPGRFSFNVEGGRCEACEGNGANRLEMDFLADVWVTCPVCQGRRFNKETLDVRFKGKNIAEVLDMDVQQALEHFEHHPKIRQLLQTLHDVGLDYLKLGQPSPTLSGGEAQRVKLAKELGKRSTGKTVYILDEPTTGLHFWDVEHLLRVLHGFVDAGNTVIVVEHNLDVIKTADWVIDLGPEGGAGGGRIVVAGTPEEVAACAASYTGQALKAHLENGPRGEIRDRRGPLRGAAGGIPAARSSPRWQTAAALASHNGAKDNIVVRGAAQHNLQRVDVQIPRERISVFCGPSGSGKSSLAMDTLYAEGQRRYVESLSSYARQFIGQMPKPKVEHIHGLQPAIAIEQKTVGNTPRSTVGTVTEIYDYLRILYARLGTPHCPACGIPVQTQTTDDVIDALSGYPANTRLLILAPQEVAVGQHYARLWERLREQGFRRVRIDGVVHTLDDVPEIDRRRKHTVEIVVDRVTIGSGTRGRLAEAVEAAFTWGQGLLRVAVVDEAREETKWRVLPFSLFRSCTQCGRNFEELSPQNFSFNSPLGWCPACEGLGTQQGTNLAALIADPTRTLESGAVAAWPDPATRPLFRRMLRALAAECDLPLDVPFAQLEPAQQRLVLYGAGERWITVGLGDAANGSENAASNHGDAASQRPKKRAAPGSTSRQTPAFSFQYKGLYPAIEEASRVSFAHRQQLYELVGEVPCSTCGGSRLRDDAAAVRLSGKTLHQLGRLPLREALHFLQHLKLTGAQKKIAGDLLAEATSRLSFLVDVGLHYLTLARPLPTLSGGESQRIRLAGQIGRALTGVLYVLDEPTIGLHASDNGRLLAALRKLRDLGNTIVMVEHDREVLQSADRLYDFGPGAGRLGGTITAEGTPQDLARRAASLTGKYLAEREQILIPEVRRMPSRFAEPATGKESKRSRSRSSGRGASGAGASGAGAAVPPGGGWLELLGCRQNNLRNVDLRIPLGTLTAVTGVSGSGKSSLIHDTLAKAVARKLHRASEQPGPHDELRGLEFLSKLIVVDQQPLGSTPASNPATYTGVFDEIRELFARLPDAKVRGYRPARFSFNRPGGRCEACEGNGQKRIEMHFLPDVWIECEACRGQRYNPETLAVKFHGKSIADVLAMSIGEALELFHNLPRIRGPLAILAAIGLDYLTLGQPAPTLSGGEAQRVKLAAELARPQSGGTLYLLDEPTTGLHFDDIRKLLRILHSLVDAGNTVVVIEHNLDVIKTADWIIDLGPHAGNEGGWIVAEGTPEDVVREWTDPQRSPRPASEPGAPPLRSLTAECLAPLVRNGPRGPRESFDPASVLKSRTGDVDLAQVGKNARMPWESDGRKWHTRDRIAHNGKPCRWDGGMLARLIDRLEAHGGFAPANWNSRSVVEIAGTNKTAGWFLHAMTGDEWVLTLRFRVPRNTFREEELSSALKLTNLDDLNDVPVFGRQARVRVKNVTPPWQEVAIGLLKPEEMDTPAFEQFLSQAIASYLDAASPGRLDLDELTPWKKLGRKWHLLRKGFLQGKIAWEVAVLERLFELLEEIWPDAKVEWGQKVLVNYRRKNGARLATVVTKRPAGVDLELTVPPGSVPFGRINGVGEEESVQHKNGVDLVHIRLTTVAQVASPRLRELLIELGHRS